MSQPETSASCPRLFCAVVWDSDSRASLLDLQEAVRAPHASVPLRWLAPEDLHLTLRYFGDVADATRVRLSRAIAELATITRGSHLDLLRLETWPPIRPRVLVARFRAEPALVRLQAAVEREARSLGLAPEAHRFQPHVTLARAAPGWNGGLARLKLAPLRLEARELALWHKALDSTDRRYAESARWPLAPAATHDL